MVIIKLVQAIIHRLEQLCHAHQTHTKAKENPAAAEGERELTSHKAVVTMANQTQKRVFFQRNSGTNMDNWAVK